MNKESDNFNKKYSKKINKFLTGTNKFLPGKQPYYNNKKPSISLKDKYAIKIKKSNQYFKTKLLYTTKSTILKVRLTILIMKNNKSYRKN
jgi:hypothetical protein